MVKDTQSIYKIELGNKATIIKPIIGRKKTKSVKKTVTEVLDNIQPK